MSQFVKNVTLSLILCDVDCVEPEIVIVKASDEMLEVNYALKELLLPAFPDREWFKKHGFQSHELAFIPVYCTTCHKWTVHYWCKDSKGKYDWRTFHSSGQNWELIFHLGNDLRNAKPFSDLTKLQLVYRYHFRNRSKLFLLPELWNRVASNILGIYKENVLWHFFQALADGKSPEKIVEIFHAVSLEYISNIYSGCDNVTRELLECQAKISLMQEKIERETVLKNDLLDAMASVILRLWTLRSAISSPSLENIRGYLLTHLVKADPDRVTALIAQGLPPGFSEVELKTSDPTV